MAVLRNQDTGEVVEVEGEIPIFRQMLVESFDEDDNLVQTPTVEIDGEWYTVVDDGVETFETG